ncbi:acetate--CoA ligase family protein [Candidatus Woesearchaeota archaeon]|nr:acetate--CoA ligase family protein [Candidatus Woesearchaeota archaeon]
MKQLDLSKTLELLTKYDIQLSPCELIKSKKDAIRIANKLGYPVAIKVASSFVVHKSDAGGVIVNVKDDKSVEKAIDNIDNSVKKKHGRKPDLYLVQKMAKGVELILGMKNDPTFGPIMMFGLGGIFVEIFKDVSFRSIPLCNHCMDEMIHDIKAHKILEGARGQKGINVNKLKSLMMKISKMTLAESFEELDFNPVFADEKDVYIADVRIMVKDDYDSDSVKKKTVKKGTRR